MPNESKESTRPAAHRAQSVLQSANHHMAKKTTYADVFIPSDAKDGNKADGDNKADDDGEGCDKAEG